MMASNVSILDTEAAQAIVLLGIEVGGQPPDRGGRRRDEVGRGGQDAAPPGVKGNYGDVASALS